MNVGPVIQREMRVQARSPMTWRLRLLAVGLAVGCFALVANSPGGYHAGQRMFEMLHFFTILGALIICPLLTSDSISREKREGTLPLLMLSCLSPRDIVWGKAAAHALRAYLLWLAAVPILCLPLLLGGIPFQLVVIMLVIEAGLIALSLSAGMMASALSRNAAAAAVAAYGILCMTAFASFIVGPIAVGLASITGGVGTILAAGVVLSAAALAVWIHVNSAASEVTLYGKGWQTGNSPAPVWVPPPSVVPVSVSTATVGSVAPEAPPVIITVPPAITPAPREEPGVFGRWLQRRHARLLAERPIEWLLCRGYGENSREYFAFLWLLLVGYLALMTLLGGGSPGWIFVPLLIGMTIMVSRNLQEERQNGMLELLFIIPQMDAQIPGAQLGRFRRIFLPALTVCGVLGVGHGILKGDLALHPLWVVAFTSLLVLPAVGLWWTLTVRHPLTVLLGTAVCAWLLPWLCALVLHIAVDASSYSGYEDGGRAWTFFDVVFVLAHGGVGVLGWRLALRSLAERSFLERSFLERPGG